MKIIYFYIYDHLNLLYVIIFVIIASRWFCSNQIMRCLKYGCIISILFVLFRIMSTIYSTLNFSHSTTIWIIHTYHLSVKTIVFLMFHVSPIPKVFFSFMQIAFWQEMCSNMVGLRIQKSNYYSNLIL